MSMNIYTRAKVVTAAGTGINLALGVLYTWSIFKSEIKRSIEGGGTGAFNWEMASLNDPYAVCCLVFACMMILAGKCQDSFGPAKTAAIGGALVGVGFIWISQTTSYISWILGFGVLVGTGIAFGYSSATPPALKWHAPTKTGLIAGIVVSGFGLAAVYIAPLASYLLNSIGLQQAMLVFGIAFFIVLSLLSTLLKNPPEGYVPEDFAERRGRCVVSREARGAIVDGDVPPLKVIKTLAFWELWVLYFIGAGAGLMVIGSVAGMAKKSLGENAFWAVAILAVGNAGGRLVAGVLSDRIGRRRTLAAIFLFQAAMMFLAVQIVGTGATSPILLVLIATFIGFNYGANLTLFPSFAKDMWGMKNFGVNYGLLFTAWGVGGFLMSRASQTLIANTGSFTSSFLAAGLLLLVGMGITFMVRDEKDAARRDVARRMAAKGAR